MKTIAVILFSVILGVAGQLFLKQGVRSSGAISGLSWETVSILFRPLVILGFISYGVSSLGWLVVLSRTELSFAYPMVALGYVLVFFFSWWFFGDKVTAVRVIGLVLICLGVVLVALSKPPGTA